MKVKDLYALLDKALKERPELAEFDILVDSEIDDTKSLGIFENINRVLILCEDSYISKTTQVISISEPKKIKEVL